MSRIFVFEIPDAAAITGQRLARHVAKACTGAELRCTMDFAAWVRLNGYDKSSLAKVPCFPPRGVDPRKLADFLTEQMRTPIEGRRPKTKEG